jgi:hypothetical protein
MRDAGDVADSPTRATKKTAALFKVLLFFLCAKRLAQTTNTNIAKYSGLLLKS